MKRVLTPPLDARPVARLATTAKADSCQLAASMPEPPFRWSTFAAADQDVAVGAAEQHVLLAAAAVRVGEQDVVAGVAVDDVLARAAADHVVAAVAGEPVVAAVAVDDVGERRCR